MKKKFTVGYFYCKNCEDYDDTLFIKEISKKYKTIPIIFEEQNDFDMMLKLVKQCDVIINYASVEPYTFESLELSKTFEEMGVKIINSSHSYYYQEDKWMFYLKCLENDIPTPKTHFIPKKKHNSQIIKEYLKKGPLVIKAIFSDKGLCVERAKNYKEFEKKLSKISSRNPISPIIAQEFILNETHQSLRVTLVGYKVVQSIIKCGHSWKQTGGLKKAEHYKKMVLSPKLKKICEKASKAFGMEVCGLDLIYGDNEWHIIEANSCPGLGFIKSEKTKLMNLIADYAYKSSK